MILSDIKRYLRERKQASLEDIALHFGSSAEATRGMLDLWIKKGQVECCQANDACGTRCHSCDVSAMEIYRWIGPLNQKGMISAKNLS